MTPQQAQQRLAELKAEKQELPKVIETNPTHEQRFLELIQGLKIRLNPDYPNSIPFFKMDRCFIELDLKIKIIWLSSRFFWLVFEREFALNDYEIGELMKTLLQKYFKLEGFTPGVGVCHYPDY